MAMMIPSIELKAAKKDLFMVKVELASEYEKFYFSRNEVLVNLCQKFLDVYHTWKILNDEHEKLKDAKR